MWRGLVRQHQDLEVYQLAFDAAMQIFELSKQFPVEERYSLTDSDATVIEVGLCKFGGGMAKAAV